MRVVEPAHNVELRRDRHGQDSVVFAFPSAADGVAAVRAIPGRRFDWEAKEWWAPRADATAPYVKGVLERHTALSVSPQGGGGVGRAGGGWGGGGAGGGAAGWGASPPGSCRGAATSRWRRSRASCRSRWPRSRWRRAAGRGCR